MDIDSIRQLLSSEVANLLIRALVFIFLLGCSALISGAEVALFSLSPTDLEAEEQKNNSSLEIISQLLKNPQKLLATILIANNLVNISIVLVFAPLGDFFFKGMPDWLRAVFEVGILTFVILLCGEILPKIYANRNNILFASKVAPIIRFLGGVLSPLSIPMTIFS